MGPLVPHRISFAFQPPFRVFSPRRTHSTLSPVLGNDGLAWSPFLAFHLATMSRPS